MSSASMSALQDDWPALSELLDQALALPWPQRDAWLADLAGASAAHRSTLRELLATQREIETGDFLHELPPLAPSTPQFAGACAGAIVGPYRLMAQIGQGGMASVWLAVRVDGLIKRQVALKLPAVAWGEAFATRLAREREILASLTHDHIARLYDAGVDAHGRPFFAMELIEGEPIDVFCRERRLSLAARVDLLLQVMAAVAHAHARLVVHRDLKPRNILVRDDARVSLLDFGIAKLLDGKLTEETALTRAAGHALTPDYASPEQIRGEPLGTSSDVYSLAVVAYELLAGDRPYRLKRAGAAELAQAIAAARAPLASETAGKKAGGKALSRQLRGDLDAILNKALKPEPEERYPTMDAFAQDLRRWRSGEPVQARPDGLGYRAAKFIGRYRLQVAAGAIVAAALVAGATVALWQARAARLEADRARIEAATSKAVRGFIESVFLTNTGNQDDPQRARETTARELLDRGAERIPLELAGVPDAQFELCGLMFDMYVHMGLNERAAVIGRRRLALARRHFGADDERTIAASVSLAKALVEMNQREEARTLLQDASERTARRPGSADELRMTIAGNLAALYFSADPQRALWQARLAAALARGKPVTQETINAQQMLGDTANNSGHLEEAEAAFTEAQAQIATQPESGRGGLPLILASLGEVQDQLGRVAVAGETLARARALAERVGDPYSLHIVVYRLAAYQRRNGMLREAVATAAAGDAWGRTAGPDFGTLPISMAGQHARALVAYGDPAQALAVIDSVRARLPELAPNQQGPILAMRAEALVSIGRSTEADADIRRAADLVGGPAAAAEPVDTVRVARRRYWQATGQAARALADLREGGAAAAGAAPSPLAALRRRAEEAQLLWSAGRADDARAAAVQVLASLASLTERRYAWQAEAEAAEVLGRALLDAGQAAAAASHLSQAVALRDAQEDPTRSPALAAALSVRAACQRAMGDAAAAAADAARARRLQAAASFQRSPEPG